MFLIIAILILIAGILLWILPWKVCGIGADCGPTSQGAVYARSLPSERLERLYRDMEAFCMLGNQPPRGWRIVGVDRDSATHIPEEFADLHVVYVRPSEGRIMVQGCLDSFVFLKFESIAARYFDYVINRDNQDPPLASRETLCLPTSPHEVRPDGPQRRIFLEWGEGSGHPYSGEELLWPRDGAGGQSEIGRLKLGPIRSSDL